jgi:hypothetical protein
MLQDSAAQYDGGSSTESECYDEELLELATNASNAPIAALDPTTEVKVEPTGSVETDSTALTAAKVEAEGVEDPGKPKAKSTYKQCKRCRRKLPVVSEKEKNEIQQGKLSTKCCACCGEPYPMSKFSTANRDPTRAIPRCRSCSQAPPEILHRLRKSSLYAEAAAVEMKKVQEERQKKKASLPHFERKTVKQRHEEQFQLVGGKTARERRVAKREAERQERLASIRRRRKEQQVMLSAKEWTLVLRERANESKTNAKALHHARSAITNGAC